MNGCPLFPVRVSPECAIARCRTGGTQRRPKSRRRRYRLVLAPRDLARVSVSARRRHARAGAAVVTDQPRPQATGTKRHRGLRPRSRQEGHHPACRAMPGARLSRLVAIRRRSDSPRAFLFRYPRTDHVIEHFERHAAVHQQHFVKSFDVEAFTECGKWNAI